MRRDETRRDETRGEERRRGWEWGGEGKRGEGGSRLEEKRL